MQRATQVPSGTPIPIWIKHFQTQLQLSFNQQDTVGDLITKVSERLSIPRDKLTLVWAGVKLEDEKKRLNTFAISNETIMHAIQVTGTAENSASSLWKRQPYTPLEEVSPPVLAFEEEFSRVPIFIWCEKSVHKPLVNKEDNIAFPQQVQRAKIRVQCAKCSCKAIDFTDSSADVKLWTDILVSPSRFQALCFKCESEQPVTFLFKCSGERKHLHGTQSLCKEYSSNSFVLPNIVENTNLIESVDTMGVDSYQIQFTGCECRFNASDMQKNYSLLRNFMVKNKTQPDLLGNYIIRCFSGNPKCGFAYRSALRILGDDLYRNVRDWQAIETTLASGGVQCLVCLDAFIPAGRGPKSLCVTCGEICEMHGGLWKNCERKHSDHCVCSYIEDTLTEGSCVRCSNSKCRAIGQKDENCTHITCRSCDTEWCYFCGNTRTEYMCTRGCPQFFSRYEPTAPEGNDISRGMVKFHKLRTTRMLKELRNTSPNVFDQCFRNHFPHTNSYAPDVSISVEVGKIILSVTITLSEIISYSSPRSQDFPATVFP